VRAEDDAPIDVDRGYALQREAAQRRLAAGDRIAGYKAAFTSAAAQRAFNVASPAYAPLLESMRIEPGGTLDASEYSGLRAEVEIAFRLGAPLDAPFDPAALRRAVESLHVALELPDVGGAPPASAGALISEGLGARHFAVGAPHRPQGMNAAGLACALEVDGAVFSRGRGSAALGDPWRALEWLAAEHLKRGGRLRAGDVILTGSLGEVWAAGATPPQALVGRCDGLGEVRVRVVNRS
jgi:2-keto-4-pentenoate hydratase